MKRLADMRPTIAVAAAIAVTSVSFATPGAAAVAQGPRIADDIAEDFFDLPAMSCNMAAEQIVWLPAAAKQIEIAQPSVGDPINNVLGEPIANFTSIVIASDETGRRGARFTAVGSGEVCKSYAEVLSDFGDDIPESIDYRIKYRRQLRPSEISRCNSVPWGERRTAPRRNGWVRCSTTRALIRGWKRKAAKRPRSKPLARARIRGFRCVQRPDEITCVRGKARATWRATKPKVPKPPPRPIPGPLGWGEAKHKALGLADEFPIYVEKRKVTWCNRWDAWEIHCGVRGWNTTFDYELNEPFTGDSCSGTAYIRKKPGQHARAYHDGDFLCFYEDE